MGDTAANIHRTASTTLMAPATRTRQTAPQTPTDKALAFKALMMMMIRGRHAICSGLHPFQANP